MAAYCTGCRSVRIAPQRQQLGQVALGVEVAVEVGLAHADDVEAAERVEPLPVADDERRLRLAHPTTASLPSSILTANGVVLPESA